MPFFPEFINKTSLLYNGMQFKNMHKLILKSIVIYLTSAESGTFPHETAVARTPLCVVKGGKDAFRMC